jgi:Sulfotransferase domain
MAVRVIGAGLGRTGTLSLKAALEELGFGACYHMIELLSHPEQVHFWEAASRKEPVDWDALFDGYQSAADFPACRYYREMMEHYPDAKVILTVRDPNAWYESTRETIYQVGRPLSAESDRPPAPLPFPGDPLLFKRIFDMVQRDVWQGDFDGRFENREYAIEVFNRHIATVREHVPSDRLLVYQVKDGWEPLCRFLGVPVPENEPFPYLNDREAFRAMTQARAPEH